MHAQENRPAAKQKSRLVAKKLEAVRLANATAVPVRCRLRAPFPRHRGSSSLRQADCLSKNWDRHKRGGYFSRPFIVLNSEPVPFFDGQLTEARKNPGAGD
jgi:hypothetical protein